MENCSFQSQVLSVMEVLAKAAVAEIKRRVDDSCAVLRLELSQSRRDIELLQRKCEVMEAELRRTRVRARRKVFSPPAAERVSPLVRIVWNREDAEVQPQQLADSDPADEGGHVQLKEERWEDEDEDEDKLIHGSAEPQSVHTDNFVDHYQPAEIPADAAPVVPPADGYDAFPEQQLNGNQHDTDVAVKPEEEEEEEPDESAAPLDPERRLTSEEVDGQLWSSRDADDSSFPYAGHQFEQIPSVFTPHSSLHLQDLVPRIHSVGKSVVVSAARSKRRVRAFGCKRAQPDEGQITSIDQSSIPQQSQHQCRDSAPHVRGPEQAGSNPAAPASTFSLVRRMRMRTQWTCGIGEKRFGCTYCDKSFMRFSQLKEHLRSHTGEKPFSCLQCGRSFTKQCNLIRHAVVHSGEKPHECALCGKCFTQRSSLKSHQKTAH